jgi:hypothetical protein
VIFQKVNKEKTLYEAINVNEIVYIKGKKGGANVETIVTFASGSSVRTNLSYNQFDELFEKFNDAYIDVIYPNLSLGTMEDLEHAVDETDTVETLLDELTESTETKTKGGKEKGKEAKG